MVGALQRIARRHAVCGRRRRQRNRGARTRWQMDLSVPAGTRAGRSRHQDREFGEPDRHGFLPGGAVGQHEQARLPPGAERDVFTRHEMDRFPVQHVGSGACLRRRNRQERESLMRRALPILALWAFALLAYSNSFRAGFVFDNERAILRDSRVHAATSENLHLILNEEYWYQSTATLLYRPLTTFSYLLNYAIFGNGPHPAGYHWVNFALHAVNIALVYLLGLLMFQETGPKERLALALAGVWALHPVLTESVTNIVGRADLLAGFGVLAGLLCYAKSVAACGRRKLAWLAALALAAAIGMFSKESAVVLRSEEHT